MGPRVEPVLAQILASAVEDPMLAMTKAVVEREGARLDALARDEAARLGIGGSLIEQAKELVRRGYGLIYYQNGRPTELGILPKPVPACGACVPGESSRCLAAYCPEPPKDAIRAHADRLQRELHATQDELRCTQDTLAKELDKTRLELMLARDEVTELKRQLRDPLRFMYAPVMREERLARGMEGRLIADESPLWWDNPNRPQQSDIKKDLENMIQTMRYETGIAVPDYWRRGLWEEGKRMSEQMRSVPPPFPRMAYEAQRSAAGLGARHKMDGYGRCVRCGTTRPWDSDACVTPRCKQITPAGFMTFMVGHKLDDDGRCPACDDAEAARMKAATEAWHHKMTWRKEERAAEAEQKRPHACDCGAAKARTTHSDWCSSNGR